MGDGNWRLDWIIVLGGGDWKGVDGKDKCGDCGGLCFCAILLIFWILGRQNILLLLCTYLHTYILSEHPLLNL